MGEGVPRERFVGDGHEGMEDMYMPLLHSAAEEALRLMDSGIEPDAATREALGNISMDMLQVERALHSITRVDIEEKMPKDARVASWTELFEQALVANMAQLGVHKAEGKKWQRS